MAAALPNGTVTFLFTDIEGSTQILQRLGDRFAAILANYHCLLRKTWAEHGEVEVNTAGDGFVVAVSMLPPRPPGRPGRGSKGLVLP